MNKIGDISAEKRNEFINHEEKADVGENLDISPEEKELLYFLLSKHRERENALNIVVNCKPERGEEFYTPILDLKTKALNDIDKIDGEVTKKLKDYLSSKSDEEKYNVAELLNKQGLQDFIANNIGEFGEKLLNKFEEDLKNSDWEFSDAGIKLLAENWKNSLQPGFRLELGKNQIGDEGAEKLAKEGEDSLQPGMIINLSENNIGEEGVEILAKEGRENLKPGMTIDGAKPDGQNIPNMISDYIEAKKECDRLQTLHYRRPRPQRKVDEWISKYCEIKELQRKIEKEQEGPEKQELVKEIFAKNEELNKITSKKKREKMIKKTSHIKNILSKLKKELGLYNNKIGDKGEETIQYDKGEGAKQYNKGEKKSL